MTIPKKRSKKRSDPNPSPSTSKKRRSSATTTADDGSKKRRKSTTNTADLADVRDDDLKPLTRSKLGKSKPRSSATTAAAVTDDEDDSKFVGEPIPADESRLKWPHRYVSKAETEVVTITLSDGSTEDQEFVQARCHYSKAIVDGKDFNLYDNACIKAPDGEEDYIAKIVEMYETVRGDAYICAQWYYRAKDTVIKNCDYLIDSRRVFFSDVKNDNSLDCILRSVQIAKIGVNMSADEKNEALKSCELYFDMAYSFPFAFTSLYTDDIALPKDSKSMTRSNITLLDLYAGCGAMSSGLNIGATLGGVKVTARWAVDFNSHACDSLRHNHPETEVRHEKAEDFLRLLKEWQILCKEHKCETHRDSDHQSIQTPSDDSEIDDGESDSEAYEVEKLLDICYGDLNKTNNPSLYYKVRWKGYDQSFDTWEPCDGLSHCKKKIKEFVIKGYKDKILPLPGDVDFLCGGPPCQGISGFNRYRVEEPLDDPKNYQLIVYMKIAKFLRPRYLLMENVTDIFKFSKGKLTNYAVGRLVKMNYQARIGIMPAGSYGVPQCRMRFFLWGAAPTECLPQFPLPTHKFMKKGVVINEFKETIVGHGNEHNELQDSVLLGEALSDLPMVTNYADQDEMVYGGLPQTDFQNCMRLTRHDIFGCTYRNDNDPHRSILCDHRPLKLNEDDYERVCLIPREKGANFRNLPGVILTNNVAGLNPDLERSKCKSGKFLVPDYALTFEDGKSSKPFGRLWTDEIVGTVVTRAEPHNQALLHWDQDRVLTVRENARLQGFPDCYKLFGPVKERYMQVGNAVSFSVSIPLGYCLAKAIKEGSFPTPIALPFMFPDCFRLVKAEREKLEAVP